MQTGFRFPLLKAELLAVGLAMWLGATASFGQGRKPWLDLFDGKSLTGWIVSEKTGHGKGGKWEVVEGAIEGDQDSPGSGGILMTEKEYGDFVLEMEINPDWGSDSGIFLRSGEDGKAYQVMVDYREGGNVGGVYGEGIGGFKEDFPDYQSHYKKGEWNKVRIRMTGNPPSIQVRLNGHRGVSWKGEDANARPAKGRIALQVHGGSGWPPGNKTRFRNIRLREIED